MNDERFFLQLFIVHSLTVHRLKKQHHFFMRKLIRTAYRLLIKNRIIRWTWLLALVLYGVKIGTDRGLAWRKTASAKTIFTISPDDIENFTIQNDAAEDVTFSRQDTVWLAVKNNVTLRLPEDSVRPYLTLFSKIERLAIKTPQNTEGSLSPTKWTVSVFNKKGVKQSFSVHYNAFDSISNEQLTFMTFKDEPSFSGVRGAWMSVLSKNFDDFRDRRLFDFSLNQAVDVTFQSTTDSLVFYRNNVVKDTLWRNRNNIQIESFIFQNFVDHLDILRGPIFYDADRDLLADRKISNRLTIKTATDTAIVTAYKLDNFYVVHSSRNPNNYFKMDSTSTIFFK
jgi:hypothetical protein